MANKIIVTESGVVCVRIDNAYTLNAQHFLTPFVKDGKNRYFGSFKFENPEEAKATLKEAVRKLGAYVEDTVFDGAYPNWREDNYGTSLNVSGRVKFYAEVGSSELIPDEDVEDYIYSIEIHLTKTKDNGIFLRVARAIAMKAGRIKFNDDLFDDDNEEDLPF